jgi:hypothetical protein
MSSRVPVALECSDPNVNGSEIETLDKGFGAVRAGRSREELQNCQSNLVTTFGSKHAGIVA